MVLAAASPASVTGTWLLDGKAFEAALRTQLRSAKDESTRRGVEQTLAMGLKLTLELRTSGEGQLTTQVRAASGSGYQPPVEAKVTWKVSGTKLVVVPETEERGMECEIQAQNLLCRDPNPAVPPMVLQS
jgi:hypothetical protein